MAGVIVLIVILLYIKYKNRRPRYGTQEYLDWKYKDYPGGGEYMKSLEKKNMTCSFGDISLTPSEKAAYNKHERANGRRGIED